MFVGTTASQAWRYVGPGDRCALDRVPAPPTAPETDRVVVVARASGTPADMAHQSLLTRRVVAVRKDISVTPVERAGTEARRATVSAVSSALTPCVSPWRSAFGRKRAERGATRGEHRAVHRHRPRRRDAQHGGPLPPLPSRRDHPCDDSGLTVGGFLSCEIESTGTMLRAVPLLYHPDAATGRTDLWGALLPGMPDTVPLPEEPSLSIESVLRIMEIDVAMLLQNSILEEFLEGLHEDPGEWDAAGRTGIAEEDIDARLGTVARWRKNRRVCPISRLR